MSQLQEASKRSRRKKPAEMHEQIDDRALRQFAGYNMKRAYHVMQTQLTRGLEPLGLRITTYSCLILICDNPGIRQSQLAVSLDIERPNMVVILDDLEQRGWILRERVPTDRRAYALSATLVGRQVCSQAIEINKSQESAFLKDCSSADVKHFISILHSIENSS